MAEGATAIEMWRTMQRIRRVEVAIAELYPDQEMRCPVHLCIGQEAIAAGTCAALTTADAAFSTHRSHGHYLAKGGELAALLGELYGRECGCSKGQGGSMHLVDRAAGFLGAAPILGATIAIAVGAGFGYARRGERHVAAAFFGDAAVEEGTFYEAANFAALHRVPVVFVCENNGLSTCSPTAVRQPAGRRICDVARAIGLESRHADGNDVLEVARLAGEAVARARDGGGPTFLEFATDRWREHCGPNYDFALGYRDESELATWEARCPLKRLAATMQARGEWDAAAIGRIDREIEAEIAEAVRTVRASSRAEESPRTAQEYVTSFAARSKRSPATGGGGREIPDRPL